MTREELIEMLNILLDNAEIGCADITVIKHVSFDSFKFVLVQVIKALEQQPCPNAISRLDMLDAIGHGTTYTSEDLQGIIKGLPSVTPQYTDAEIQKMQDLEQAEIQKAYELGKQKTGHWIDEFGGCECSECGCLEGGYSDYCPNCGAKMESEDKEDAE